MATSPSDLHNVYLQDQGDEWVKVHKLDLQEHDTEWIRELQEAAGDYDTLRCRISSPADGTLRWPLRDKAVTNWFGDDGPSILWFSRELKCGKSVLAKYLAGELPTLIPGATVCSYFFPETDPVDPGDVPEQPSDSRQAISALLHQLFTSNPGVFKASMDDELPRKENSFSCYTSQDLWGLLCRATSQAQAEGHPVVCVLDGLDQCAQPSRDALIRDIVSTFPTDTSSLPAPFKLLITSRPMPDVCHSLGNPGRTTYLKPDNSYSRVIWQDSRLVIDSELKSLMAKGVLDKPKARELRALLHEQSNATLFRATSVLKIIEQDTTREAPIDTLIRDGTLRLDAFYDKALAALGEDPSSYELLRYLAAATEPMSLRALDAALSLTFAEPAEPSSRDTGRIPQQDTECGIRRLGGLFIRVSESEFSDSWVEWVHPSAREYLLRLDSFDLVTCELALTERFVRFLLETTPRGKSDSMALNYLQECQWKFHQDAGRGWYSHIGELEAYADANPGTITSARIRELRQSIKTLWDPSQDYLGNWWIYFAKNCPRDRECWTREGSVWYCTKPPRKGETPQRERQYLLHSAVEKDDPTVLAGLLSLKDGPLSVTDRNDDGLDLLVFAIDQRASFSIEWLLENYRHVEFHWEGALNGALSAQRADGLGMTYLGSGHSILKSLICPRGMGEKKEDLFSKSTRIPKFPDMDEGTAAILSRNLALPCVLGRLDVVEGLVASGADVNATTMGIQPLLAAVLSQSEDLVKFLLENGANPDDRCSFKHDEGESSFACGPDSSARSSHDAQETSNSSPMTQEAIDTFLQGIWDLLKPDRHTDTPLSLAATFTHDADIVALIQERGITDNTTSLIIQRVFRDEGITSPSEDLRRIVLENIDLWSMDDLRRPLVYRVASDGQPSTMSEVIGYGGLEDSGNNSRMKTPLHGAAESGRSGNIEVLAGDPTGREMLRAVDGSGRTCLRSAFLAGQGDAARMIIKLCPDLLYTAVTMPDVNMMFNEAGEPAELVEVRSMLHDAVYGAVKAGKVDIVNVALTYTGDVDEQDDEGRTALHHLVLAVRAWMPAGDNTCVGAEVAKMLVLQGAEYFMADKAGLTPLGYTKEDNGRGRDEREQAGVEGGGIDVETREALERARREAIRDVERTLQQAPLWGDNRLNQEAIMANYREFTRG
ncbi:uncharacterized protein DNG_10066 [Cephalotrichum gorgonifer]|uniref:Nephrocystin 3-like N-terminal domain-containing protein n=1 Tax=Cephalotrichum gorgonifer TaxID=2041049 RepID=A0AAE8N715_9PEZI|nr:uncharacterized protein DNG_10066 [Cephalotrichum gorgonifer]